MASEKKEYKLKPEYPYYLANKAVFANKNLKVLDKYKNEVATYVAQADEDVIDQAIQAAVDSQEALKKMTSWQRKEVLEHVVSEMKKRKHELAYALCIEAGKPIHDALGEVNRGITTFQLAAEESTRLYGDYMPLDISPGNSGYSSIVRRFPIGPISMISPFNFPINLAAHKIAPAIAAGCPFVLKPASRTPIGALIIGEILAQTNLPAGSFSILPCNRKGADLFTTDERFKLVSFTGSPAVGWAIKARAGKKKVVLELGGNAACILDEDVDVADAVQRVVHGAFYQSGQSCISVQRCYVHKSRYDEFTKALVAKVATLKTGDPTDEQTFIGPMITEKDAKRCADWVEEAVGKGAKVLVGGKQNGVFYDATVVENVPKGCKLNDDEVFGPVMAIEAFTDFKDAVAKVNDSVFGLQAGVFTNNLNRAWYAFENIEAGGVCINEVPSKRVDNQPYGGVKDSGLGREGLRYAIEDMTEPRVMILRNVGKI